VRPEFKWLGKGSSRDFVNMVTNICALQQARIFLANFATIKYSTRALGLTVTDVDEGEWRAERDTNCNVLYILPVLILHAYAKRPKYGGMPVSASRLK
jgi:hypothetical protein